MSATERKIVLILRFRDLVRPEPDFTIREHSLIIEKNGYVWWSWWKKQTEQVPYELWNELAKQIARDKEAEALLLDSGQRKLYRTKILGLETPKLGAELVSSPEEGHKTPNYYNQESFATWFKLGQIEETPPDSISSYAYRQVPHDDLVTFDRSAFENRKIASVAQLLEFGNITYWVATPASADALDPSNVPIRTRMPPAISGVDVLRAERAKLLHISDLHVAEDYHAFAFGKGDRHNLSLAAALHQSIGNANLPGLVVVSGDLTWTGSKEEFDLAFDVLDSVRSTLGLNRQDFVIIPGNHDIQWTKAQTGSKRYKWDGKVEIANAEARKNYENFFRRWYGVQPNSTLSIGRRFFLMGGPTMDILGLNSCELQQIEGHFAGLGRITTAAFQDSAKEFDWTGSTRATKLRVLVTHHHLLPVNALERPKDLEKGFGVALDAEGQLVSASEFGVDLVLHGHQHQPYAGFTVRQPILGNPPKVYKGVLVLGCGSTGVVDEHLGPIKQRCFNLLHVHDSHIDLDIYGTPSVGTEFVRISQLTARYGEAWRPSTK